MIVLMSNGKVRCLDCARDDWTPTEEGVVPWVCRVCFVPADRRRRPQRHPAVLATLAAEVILEESRNGP